MANLLTEIKNDPIPCAYVAGSCAMGLAGVGMGVAMAAGYLPATTVTITACTALILVGTFFGMLVAHHKGSIHRNPVAYHKSLYDVSIAFLAGHFIGTEDQDPLDKLPTYSHQYKRF